MPKSFRVFSVHFDSLERNENSKHLNTCLINAILSNRFSTYNKSCKLKIIKYVKKVLYLEFNLFFALRPLKVNQTIN